MSHSNQEAVLRASAYIKLIKNSSVLLVLAAAATLVFSSWGKPGHYIGGYAVGQLAITQHQLNLEGKLLAYQATTGYMPIADKNNKPLANIFYAAYTANSNAEADTRPITFVFNGGPGSASIWLHMGSFGPTRVVFKNDKGDAPDQQYQYQDNPYSWLGFTDLVFIDPVSTGYSRPQDGVDAKQFYSYKADISSIGEFIRLYLLQHNRQSSPKYLAGESYGAIRAIGLAEYLQDSYKIALDGITLISPALNYRLINFNNNNQKPYSYYLPSYAVAAQYHHRLAPELQRLTTEQLLTKARSFAQGTYTRFLNQGDTASSVLTKLVIDSLNYFTGLPKTYLQKVNARVSDRQFNNELLKNDSLTVGNFDTRFTGSSKQAADPSEANLRGLFAAAFNNYVGNDLKYQNNLPYKATIAVGNWDYGTQAANPYFDISATLKKVITQNPNLKINVACGYYDLATPVGTTEYVLNQLGLKPQSRKQISINYYQSGHMIYITQSANAKFKADAEKFYRADNS